MSFDPVIHVEHVTDGSRPCWCQPEVLVPCGECGGADPAFDQHFARVYSVKPRDPDCWRCGGRGLVPCDELNCADGALCERSHITVHKPLQVTVNG